MERLPEVRSLSERQALEWVKSKPFRLCKEKRAKERKMSSHTRLLQGRGSPRPVPHLCECTLIWEKIRSVTKTQKKKQLHQVVLAQRAHLGQQTIFSCTHFVLLICCFVCVLGVFVVVLFSLRQSPVK